MASRAPKQWRLTKNETLASFESWRQNLLYTLSLDNNFAPFLVDGATWTNKTSTTPLRGQADDGEDVPEAKRRTAAQKVTHLELLLGQIANFCPVISRNAIVKNSTCMNDIWQAIRLHFGFQTSGGHFLDFDNIKLEPGERPEDLFQRLNSFVDDNLLTTTSGISHMGETLETDEELSPTVENFIVLTWLRLIDRNLPSLVKQRYGTELRSKTLASLKPEISLALDSLLDEISASNEAKVLRSTFKLKPKEKKRSFKQAKECPLCKQAGRLKYQHYLSMCKFLPEQDRLFMTKVRQTFAGDESESESDEDECDYTMQNQPTGEVDKVLAVSRRVCTKQSPTIKMFYKHCPVTITLDTGAEISMIRQSLADYIGAPIKKSNQNALQADGVTPLAIIGETHLTLTRGNLEIHLEALVVNDLDVDILGGIPFMTANDISVRPAKQQIIIQDRDIVHYGPVKPENSEHRVRRAQAAFILRASSKSTVTWPGSYVELDTPFDVDPDGSFAIEPKTEQHSWLAPQIVDAVNGKIRILNDTRNPVASRKNEHVCDARKTIETFSNSEINAKLCEVTSSNSKAKHNDSISNIQLDPDCMLSEETKQKFSSILKQYSNVFSSDVSGYNGAVGPFQATVNMGPVLPPQRKGRVPQYARDKLEELQSKFDDLEKLGVFARPEDVGVNVEYLNPSFLVKKPQGGHRLVTAFADVGRYSKPQPSLMPDVESVLRSIGKWKYLIVSDLQSAFYQIPLSRDSLKYCGVATPYRGVRVYTRCAMGMPGSETALEELMCRILGDLLQEGVVCKLADDLYCGGDTPEQLLDNWQRVLSALDNCNMKLAPSKTVICPKTTNILGWVWSKGKLSASPHRVSTLVSCQPPETVHGLRSFVGAYKALSRVLPQCSSYVSLLDNLTAGRLSQDKISWDNESLECFEHAKTALHNHKSIAIPQPDDQLWIVTDGSVTRRGLGATLYVTRNDKLHLAGFFSAKLRKHQVTWLPCEIEALCIGASVKHFSPYIIQSSKTACVLTDSKPCVQAIQKLYRGEFSASPRVTSFLSTVSRYQVTVKHLAGSANVPSDFASRNAPECTEHKCQICSFIEIMEDSVVRAVKLDDVLNETSRLPFTTKSAWRDIQSECPDLRRVHAHLKQGTRPSKKLTNIKDIKRYLQVATISKDNVLVVKRSDPLSPPREQIIVPRAVLEGLLTALHVKLDHPSKHQLELIVKRNFFALDMSKTVERVSNSCHACASIKKFPKSLLEQSSDDPPTSVGISFAADIMKRNKQCVFVVRETVTSYTRAVLVDNEQKESTREALICLVSELNPIHGPPAVVRVDPAPAFIALRDDESLRQANITLDIGRIKNVNKNPVAEKAIAELEDELIRIQPGGDPVSKSQLSVAVARLNCRLRRNGLSSRELWTQRDQFTHEQLSISDREIILEQNLSRKKNHVSSEKSKYGSTASRNPKALNIGDIVYLYADKSKHISRQRYIVVSLDGDWCYIKKFAGNQLRSSSYKVKTSECFLVPQTVPDVTHDSLDYVDFETESVNQECSEVPSPDDIDIPPTLAHPNDTDECEPSLMISEQLDSPELSEQPDTLELPSRPQRTHKRPKYLEDYVT